MVKLVMTAISWLGYTRLVLKADNEASLQKIVRTAVRAARIQVDDLEQIAAEQPQKYDSQASGAVEVGVRNIRKDFCTLPTNVVL